MGITNRGVCVWLDVNSNGEYKRFDHESGIIHPEALQSKGKMPSYLSVTIKTPLKEDAETSNISKRSS